MSFMARSLLAIIASLSLSLQCGITPSAASDTVINTVDHKNLNLSYYLDRIKYNTEEKLGILPYILANPHGIYLEIGTGGDPIAMLLDKIPNDLSPTIIAADVDERILQSLPKRHPQLTKFLAPRATGVQLQLRQLDATTMACFPDNYLSGINASAVVHEIISYAGGLDGFAKFIVESFRVLKPGGMLIYRDPEAVAQKHELVIANFKTPAIRLFAHIFLVKFLDERVGKLAQSGRKYQHYATADLKFTLYKKHATAPQSFSYQEYLQLRSYEIDFARPYILTLPRGLCREVERHYLTYLHDCNPLIFVKCTPIVGSELYSVNYLAHSTHDVLNDLLRHKNLSLTADNLADANIYKLINTKISNNLQVLEYGIFLRLNSKWTSRQLHDLIKAHQLDPNLYLMRIKAHEYLLDYRIFGLLFDQISELLDEQNQPLNSDDIEHARWLKREGEETYIYYSDDELITKVAELSLQQNQVAAERLILCPLSAAHNKFIPRLCYNEVLNTALELNDLAGYPIKIREGKRVVHFSKLPLPQALVVLNEIVKSKPQHYQKLKKLVDTLQSEQLFMQS